MPSNIAMQALQNETIRWFVEIGTPWQPESASRQLEEAAAARCVPNEFIIDLTLDEISRGTFDMIVAR